MSPVPHPCDAALLAPGPATAKNRLSCRDPMPLPLEPHPALFRSRAFGTTQVPRGSARATLWAATAHRAPDSLPPWRNPAAVSQLGPAPAKPPHGSEPHPPLSANIPAPPPTCRASCTARPPDNSRRGISEPTPAPSSNVVRLHSVSRPASPEAPSPF